MKRFKYFLIILAAVFVIQSCGLEEAKIYSSVDEMVTEAMESVDKITPDELKTLLDQGAELQIIDVREQDLFAAGHIPGSVNVPRGMLEFSSKASNRRARTIILGNDEFSAALAVQTLQKMKFKNIQMFDGIWFEWIAYFPDLFEEGLGELTAKAEPEPSSGGGCGD